MGTIHNLSPHSVHTAITRIEYCGTQYAARITRGSLRAMGTRVYEHTHHAPGHQRATRAWSSTRDVRADINARRVRVYNARGWGLALGWPLYAYKYRVPHASLRISSKKPFYYCSI